MFGSRQLQTLYVHRNLCKVFHYYIGTTDILCSTFSFDSVKDFPHLYRPPTTTPPLYHRYELDVMGGVVVGGCM